MSDLLLAVFAGLGLFMTLAGFIINLSYRLGKLEVKIETMWMFQMRKATTEVVNSGIGSVNSPLKLDSAAIDIIAPLRKELQKMWQTKWLQMKPTTVLLDIERLFGARLLPISISSGVSNGGLLLLALAAAKESDTPLM